ncbi:MAG: hypothetical protein EOP84_02405 [Verrucomicrobiaceae bacterium]|nr:MAG: hypothetical protein EOP84_02405 [Verrucomicrobiaceae bacterium]
MQNDGSREKLGILATHNFPAPSARTVQTVLCLAFLLAVGIFHLWFYGGYENMPENHPTAGWEGWWDQSQYLRSARALAAGNLNPAEHWYPLGYPVLAAPFARAGFQDPFLIPNLILVLAFAFAFLLFFRRYIGSGLSIAVFFATMLLPWIISVPYEVRHIVWLQYVIPWNTIPVAAAYMFILLLMRSLQGGDALWRHALLGALAGLVLVCRPADLIALLPVALFYGFQVVLRERRWRGAFAAVAGLMAVIGPIALLMLSIYGGLQTPYSENIENIGLTPHYLLERAFAVGVDASMSWGLSDNSLLNVFPWLVVALPFAILAAIRRPKEIGMLITVCACAFTTYVCFNDFSPLNIFRYFLIHYIVWMLPVLAAAGCVGVVALVRSRSVHSSVLVGAGVAGMAVLSSFKAMPEPVWSRLENSVAPDGSRTSTFVFDGPQRINAVDIPGSNSNPEILYGNPYGVQFDSRPLRALSEYREVRLADRVRLVFNRPVTARTLSITLDDKTTATRADGREAFPLRWRLRLN